MNENLEFFIKENETIKSIRELVSTLNPESVFVVNHLEHLSDVASLESPIPTVFSIASVSSSQGTKQPNAMGDHFSQSETLVLSKRIIYMLELTISDIFAGKLLNAARNTVDYIPEAVTLLKLYSASDDTQNLPLHEALYCHISTTLEIGLDVNDFRRPDRHINISTFIRDVSRHLELLRINLQKRIEHIIGTRRWLTEDSDSGIMIRIPFLLRDALKAARVLGIHEVDLFWRIRHLINTQSRDAYKQAEEFIATAIGYW